MDILTKRTREKELVRQMIRLYCRGNHDTKGPLCPACADLAAYAAARSDCCPFMEAKTFCSNCAVHCYKSDMRGRIQAVMRYAGPRMIFHRPIVALRHLIETKKERRLLEVPH